MTEAVAAPASNTLSSQGLVLRNALLLVVAQLLGMPLSMLVNAAMARHLGPVDFGYLYLASTLASFGFLAVEWGGAGALPAMVAKDRAQAGALLGSGVVWRLGMVLVVYAVLGPVCFLWGYSREFQIAFALVILGSTVSSVLSACQSTIRGFERTDVSAFGTMALQVLVAAFVLPTLFFGGGLSAVLVAQAVAAMVVFALVLRTLKPTGVVDIRFRLPTLKALLGAGTAFLFFDLAMVLQPNVDAVLLSRLAPPEPIGWLAAARRLVGVLVYPASAIGSALYPTLCRLYVEDAVAFRRTAASALRTATVLAVPMAVGCGLYPDLGVRIFSRASFGPAEDDLRILSPFVLIVYFSMVLGVILVAAGRQRAWSTVQFLCVVMSAVLDPILIPYFQSHHANGGIGVCVATVASEILMLSAGVVLAPPGIFNRALFRGLFLALASGAAMLATARLLSSVTPFVAAPISAVAYGIALWVTGGVDKEQFSTLQAVVARKRNRR